MSAWGGSDRLAGLPPGWRRHTCPRILARDHRQCQIRGPWCISCATEVDHIGDRDDHRDENLRAACGPCHRRRSSAQGTAANAAARARGRRPVEPHPGMTSKGH